MSHLKEATNKFRSIPSERFKQKLGRTLVGVALFVAGAYCKKHALLDDNFTTGFMVVGGLMASFEFVQAPLTFAKAFIKDMANIVRGKNGEPPAGGA